MKAITLHPEWIVPILSDHHAAKRCENRSWRLPEAQIGRWIALHSGAAIGGRWRLGQSLDGAAGQIASDAVQAVRITANEADWPFIGHLRGLSRLDPARSTRVIDGTWRAASPGHIVALIRVDSQDQDQRTGWDVEGQWHWRIGAVVPLVAPIPQRGAQGLWHVPDAARVEIRRQLLREVA